MKIKILILLISILFSFISAQSSESSNYFNINSWLPSWSSFSFGFGDKDFEAKLKSFDNKLRRLPKMRSYTILTVTRENIFPDSYNFIMKIKDPIQLRRNIRIKFTKESGEDEGGLIKEWFSLLSNEIFGSKGQFFKCNDENSMQINPDCPANVKNLLNFEFIGRLTAMAVYKHIPLPVSLSHCFLMNMLEIPIKLEDVKYCDYMLYNSLLWIQNNDVTEQDYFFVVDELRNGKIIPQELISGGDSKKVNQENKHEFIRLLIERKYVKQIKRQMIAFMKGFKFVIPVDLIQKFNPEELELVICGLEDIDVDDWKENTSYRKCGSKTPIIKWFWEAVSSFNNEERMKLLQFVTGMSHLPQNGFQDIYFEIHAVNNALINQYPEAHTCTNTLVLPKYKSYEDLRKKLKTIIENPNMEFELA